MGRSDDEAEAPTLASPGGPPGRPSRSAIDERLAGTTISRYRLVERLGAGAMGVVWSALDPQLDRNVAIKLVHPNLAKSPEATGRLLREARAMAKLSHRAVVTVHDAGDDGGQLFIAMELVVGTNLGTLLRGRTAEELADWPRWLTLMIEAGRGLAAAHDGGVLHRDFKPDNVLVSAAGRVCVGDFGLATLGEEVFAAARTERWASREHALDLTTTGALLGTPVYMSPQGLRGEPLDARADQFSFCVATWEALYGRRPFAVTGTGLDAIPELAGLIEEGRLDESPPGATVPPAVRQVLVRGLAADPAARWPDMNALLDALEGARARPRRDEPPPARPRRSPRGALGAIAAIAAIGLAVGAVLLVRGRDRTVGAPSAPPRLVAEKLFDVSLRTAIAISPDGARMAIGSDRLEVRSLDHDQEPWIVPLGRTDDVAHVEFDGDAIRYSTHAALEIRRWPYLARGPLTTERTVPGMWLGRTDLGELVAMSDRVVILDGDREVRSYPTHARAGVTGISPSRRSIAYLEEQRYSAKIVVQPLDRDVRIESPWIESATALAWLDETTLIYAAGTEVRPTLYRVEIAGDRLGEPTEIYSSARGWFGHLRVHGDAIFMVDLAPSSRARIVDRTRGTARDFDATTVGASLGWIDGERFLTWRRETRRVDRQGPTGLELTMLELDSEPANATFAEGVLIAALRGNGGRTIVARSVTDGALLWRHGDRRTLAVRCAGDRQAPCFAVTVHDDGERVVPIDPKTGELGTHVITTGKIEDIAVREDGERLLVTNGTSVRELDATGTLVADHPVPLATTRSVAFDPSGGFLVGGTLRRNNYRVGRAHDGVFDTVLESENDILSLVRPSPSGDKILVLARIYTPSVWRLRGAK